MQITSGMSNITIGRYKPAADHGLTVPEGSVDVADLYAGWIEGTREDGSSWILWLDAKGSPDVFWAQRDPDGGIVGDPVVLGPEPETLRSS